MNRVETPEFSIEANPMFETVNVVAGMISLLRHPRTAFPPQMTVWTLAAEKKTSPQDWLSRIITDDGGKLVERKPITFAGMTGEMIKLKDKLEDWDTPEKRDWYRMRALLVSPDGKTWHQATAMVSGPDLAEIEADFMRLLGTLHIKLEGDAADAAKAAADAERDTLLAKMKDNMERVSAIRTAQAAEKRRIEVAAIAAAPVATIEDRFDAAVTESGFADKRDALRRIVMPAVTMIELEEADASVTGLSRIGGGPDLAADTDWPRGDDGLHLNFLAQINLADLPERPETLPETGLVSFFTGTDYSDWRVLYAPADATLQPHAIPEDAEDTAIDTSRMYTWDSDLKRFVPNGQAVEGLSVTADAEGRMTFTRDGRPVMAFASEYEFSRSSQTLRFEPSLSAPYGSLGPVNNPQFYADIGIDNPSEFAVAVQDRFRIGDGPQHQMFGITGVRDLSTLQQMAAEHAAKRGWSDIATSQDWFILAKLASGGEADFSFSDYGDYIFMIHRKDAAKGDVSRVYAFVESG